MELMTTNFKKVNSKDSKYPFDKLLEQIDPKIANVLKKLPNSYKSRIEEIRLRAEKPLMLGFEGKDYLVNMNGRVTQNEHEAFMITSKDVVQSFNILCGFSIYAIEEDLRNGFITIRGGHRIGISGKAVYQEGELLTIKEISSLNIRISKQKIGISDHLMPYLIDKNTIYHTLIVSPPQCGKTTLLRDIIRNISNGIPHYNFKGLKVGVVDERSEVAGMYLGKAQNDVGVRTDILDACKKYDGMNILIRSMSPNVIATDELGGKKDIDAIHEALKAGVKLLSTVHGENLEDIKTKPNLREIMNEKIFERIILLDNSNGVGTIKDIIDGQTMASTLNMEAKI